CRRRMQAIPNARVKRERVARVHHLALVSIAPATAPRPRHRHYSRKPKSTFAYRVPSYRTLSSNRDEWTTTIAVQTPSEFQRKFRRTSGAIIWTDCARKVESDVQEA